MTTFKQFLNEEHDYSKIIEMIKRDCGPFLNAAKHKLMFRGVAGLHSAQRNIEGRMVYYKKDVRKDRRPLSSGKIDHELMDEWFESEFRLTPRSTGLFGIGAKGFDFTNSYGSPCIIFPIGPIKYVWSPKVTDIYVNMHIPAEDRETPAIYREAVFKFLEDSNYTDINLDKALETRNEIMVVCSSYYAFPALQGDNSEQLSKAFT